MDTVKYRQWMQSRNRCDSVRERRYFCQLDWADVWLLGMQNWLRLDAENEEIYMNSKTMINEKSNLNTVSQQEIGKYKLYQFVKRFIDICISSGSIIYICIFILICLCDGKHNNIYLNMQYLRKTLFPKNATYRLRPQTHLQRYIASIYRWWHYKWAVGDSLKENKIKSLIVGNAVRIGTGNCYIVIEGLHN